MARNPEVWRELFIAPVMTGGTSLAVRMGGVTAELYRVLKAADVAATSAPPEGDRLAEIYGRRLEITETRPTVDVITGTSAGGLNGSLLSAA